MGNSLDNILSDVASRFSAYIPSLTAGLVLIASGLALGWVAKRIIMQVLAVLRVDRLLRRFKWGSALARADVQYAFLRIIGDVAFLVVFLILCKKALEILQLFVISSILERSLLFMPKFLASILVFGAGWLVAAWISSLVQRALLRESVPRAILIALGVKAVIIFLSFAMALAALNIARDIVVIGFTVSLITIGAVAVTFAIHGGKQLVSTLIDSDPKQG